MTSISSLIFQTLPLPPSCIAFCHTQPDLFVVGTYLLHKDENEVINGITMPWQKRSGSLILFRIEQASENEEGGLRIHELCNLQTDYAVLDVRWSPHREKGNEAIAVATSAPLLELYKLDLSPDRKSADLISSTWLVPFEDTDVEEARDKLALSLAWHPTRSKFMIFTLSNGEVQYCETEGDFVEMGLSYGTSVPSELKHELEAWTAAFSPTSIGVFSGGDDCALRYMRPRWSRDGFDGVESSWQDKRLHHAGVTAILPLSDELVVTGSYDDHVRLILAPQTGRRQVLAVRNLDGGVWRLNMIESDELLDSGGDTSSAPFTCTILASCMHAGTHVLRLRRETNGLWRFEVIARFTEHKSMNYGSDVQPLEPVASRSEREKTRVRTVVSTSFYDKMLCAWKFDADAEEPSSPEEAEM